MKHNWAIGHDEGRKILTCIHCGMSKREDANGRQYYRRHGETLWVQVLWPMTVPGCNEKICDCCGGSGKVRT